MLIVVFALWMYAVADEIVYLVRAASYNVDFKGHGFEKYAFRKDLEASAAVE
jgi:hypothetical protein